MDFDDFDWEDAIEFGAMAGFTEESLGKENENDPSEVAEDYDLESDESTENVISLDRQLEMLAAQNPGLAEYVIKKAKEEREQGELKAQSVRLANAAKEAYRLQDEEEKHGALSDETMNNALTKMAAYKWALLDEQDCESSPDVCWIEEAISEEWKIKLDFLKLDGQWEQGLIVLPKRVAKLKDNIFIYAFCDQWKKHWYFGMDRIRNLKPIPETKI
jgi:hypothetical protein